MKPFHSYFPLVIALNMGAIALAQLPSNRPAGLPEVGREMKPLEEKILEPTPPQKKKDEAKQEEIEQVIKEDLSKDPKSQMFQENEKPKEGIVKALEVKGDVEWLRAQGTETLLKALLIGESTEDMDALRDVVSDQKKALVEKQFYLANIWVGDFNEETGTLVIFADAGRIGEVKYSFKNDNPYFTEKQMRNRLGGLEAGQVFNYADVYSYVYGINSHPDLVMDTFFNVNSRVEDGLLKREIDTNFVVEDSLPVHGVFYLNNYGSEATGNWQAGVTLQHLNLTKHDDVLTLDVPVALDLGTLVSFGASYSMPYYADKGGRVTAYGGYSTLDTPDVVPELDVNGEGYFAGLQWSHNLVSNEDHLLSGSLGLVHRYIEDQLVVQGFETEPRSANVAPFSASVSYSQSTPDRFNGRNMATVQGLFNFGGVMGASDDEEIKTLRPSATADYMIARVQFARVQPIFGKALEDGSHANQWVLFMKAEGQYADGPLVPAEQIGVGGAHSVRGYIDREFFGDDGAYTNIELRTPMVFGLLSNVFNLSQPEGDDYPLDRLQGVLFFDAGYTNIQDPLPSEASGETIYSAGIGFRLALSSHAQLRFDWGFPFQETLESSTSGAGYLEFQLQF